MPRKNLREFHGKPLVLGAVDQAKQSKYLDHLIVSTEDLGIAGVCWKARRVDVAMRPEELATDNATSEDVLRHVLKTCPAEWVVLLQPTSPLRTAEDIDACIERSQMGDGCISIDRSTGHPNGAVYVAKAEWIANHDFHHAGLMKYLMDHERSLDIDTEDDFG